MMRFIILILLCSACSSGDKPVTDTSSKKVDNTEVEVNTPVVIGQHDQMSGCYIMSYKRDSAFLNLRIHDQFVSGELVYDRYQKDGNHGSINGRISNDTIKVIYKFESEGMTSFREEIFLIQNDQLIPSHGEYETNRSDTLYFKDPSRVKFDKDMPFKKVECASMRKIV